MAERLTPGVYVEEISSGIKPIQATGTSSAGFIGEAARGVPGVATFVRGFADFERAFGGHRRGPAGHLAQAVDAFFAAGGARAFVVRVLPDDALTGRGRDVLAVTDDVWGLDRPVLRLTARGPGAWADDVRVHVEPSRAFPGRAFGIAVEWVEGGRGRVVERFENLVLDPESPDYVVDVVGDSSRYLHATDLHRTEFLDADPRPLPPLPDRGARLVTRGAAGYTVPVDATVDLRWAGPDGVGATTSVSFAAARVQAAGGTLAADGRTVTLTRAQLVALLAAVPGTTLVAAEVDDTVTVTAPVATRAYLVVPPPDGSDTFDLGPTDELVLTLAAGDGSGPRTVTLDTTGAAATTPAALADLLTAAVAAADLDDDVQVHAAGRLLVVRTTAPDTDGATLTLVPDAGTPFGDVLTRDGAGGAVVDDLGAVTVVAAETVRPGVPPALSVLFDQVRDWGLRESSPLDPDLLPAPTGDTPLRLPGGTDGTTDVDAVDLAGREDANGRTGLRAFDDVDIQLLAVPGRTTPDFLAAAIAYADRRGVFYVADGPGSDDRQFAIDTSDVVRFVDGLPTRSDNLAMFYPWLEVADPVGVGRAPRRFVPPSGHVVGVFARTDRARGVWKAPAGIEATLPGALDLQHRLLDADQDLLNPIGLSCIRQRPGTGIVSWGARTLSSDPEWRYTNVRRTALFLMASLRRGLQWAVFEPNDVQLWSRIRGNVESFMLSLHRQGAFQGATPEEAFAVKCDTETNPQELIDQGIVTVQVAFAPLKPSEFVVVQLSQKTLLAA